MELTWLDPQEPDRRAVDGVVAILNAAREVDAPFEQPLTVRAFQVRLRHGWDGDPSRYGLARDGKGRPVGVLDYWQSPWDNPHLAAVAVTVDPVARRRGVGRRLFAEGQRLARASGRTLLYADCHDRPEFVRFAESVGLVRASEETLRRQDLTRVDWARVDAAYAAAAPRADGYELVRTAGPAPDGDLAALLVMSAAINDRPLGDLQLDDEVFTPERWRAFEAAQEAAGRRVYRVVARHRATGELAGTTVVLVDGEFPARGLQGDTSVVRGHRGHRLGLLLKVDMMRWLAEAEPQLRLVDTGNATSNSHMIRINEALGYAVTTRVVEWQRQL